MACVCDNRILPAARLTEHPRLRSRGQHLAPQKLASLGPARDGEDAVETTNAPAKAKTTPTASVEAIIPIFRIANSIIFQFMLKKRRKQAPVAPTDLPKSHRLLAGQIPMCVLNFGASD